MQKIVINVQFGGFGLSEKAYEKLIEWGVPVRKYIEQQRDPDTMFYLDEPANDGEVIFDRTLDDRDGKEKELNNAMMRLGGRYWDTWTSENRKHPLVLRVVEELGDEANGRHASLKIVEIPDGVEWEIQEYDGLEHVAEVHQTWR